MNLYRHTLEIIVGLLSFWTGQFYEIMIAPECDQIGFGIMFRRSVRGSIIQYRMLPQIVYKNYQQQGIYCS